MRKYVVAKKSETQGLKECILNHNISWNKNKSQFQVACQVLRQRFLLGPYHTTKTQSRYHMKTNHIIRPMLWVPGPLKYCLPIFTPAYWYFYPLYCSSLPSAECLPILILFVFIYCSLYPKFESIHHWKLKYHCVKQPFAISVDNPIQSSCELLL